MKKKIRNENVVIDFFYTGFTWPSHEVVFVIDTSDKHFDTSKELADVLKFAKSFLKTFKLESDEQKTQITIIQKNGDDVITLLKSSDTLPSLEYILSSKNFGKIGKTVGFSPGYQQVAKTALNTLLSTQTQTPKKTVIFFTKDGKLVAPIEDSFTAADVVMVPVVVGDKKTMKDGKDGLTESESVIVESGKMLPGVYGTLETVIKERHGNL